MCSINIFQKMLLKWQDNRPNGSGEEKKGIEGGLEEERATEESEGDEEKEFDSSCIPSA